MKNELTIDGIWKYRTGEKTPSEFAGMSSTLKSTYVFNVELIPEEERSTYEKVILKQYYRECTFSNKSVKVCEPVPVEIKLTPTEKVYEPAPDVQELVKLGANYVKDYLNLYFKFEYEDWETNVRFNTVDKFISNTSNFMELDEITIAHIKAYKELKK